MIGTRTGDTGDTGIAQGTLAPAARAKWVGKNTGGLKDSKSLQLMTWFHGKVLKERV